MAAAAQPSTQGQYAIRDQLVKSGIDNSQIGYDKNTGYVTVNGQNFIKPTAVINGVSYADPTQFQNQLGVYQSGQKTDAAEKTYMDAINSPQTNPYDDQVNQFLGTYLNQIQNPTPYDVYSDPQYGAYQAQAQRSADQGVRAAQEALGASGFGRSTNLADRAQNIQNQSNEYLQTQVVPQLISAHNAAQQQQLANLANYFGMLTGQQGLYDTRSQEKTAQLGDVLNYLTGRSDRAADTAYQTNRDAVADQQWQSSFDENKRQYDQNYAYQKARDQIADKHWQQQFDEDTRQFGLNYALNRQVQLGNLSLNQAQQSLAESKFAYEKQRDAKADAEKAAAAAGGLSAKDLQGEASDMLTALRGGKITPEAALQQIDDDLTLGIYSPSNAQFLRAQVARVAPDAPAKTTPTQEQLASASANMPSDQQIQAEARSKGLPVIDYADWYKSPQGRLSGVDYQTWKTLYGPRLVAN